MMVRLAAKRLVATCVLCVFFFWLGMNFGSRQAEKTTALLHPDHLDKPELVQGYERGVLKQKSTFLLILILTGPGNKERRATIRSTWLNIDRHKRQQSLHYFVVGTNDLSEAVEAQLQQESVEHKDILQLPIFDSYPNLPTKILHSFVQVDRNVDFKFLLKVDDDSYAHIPGLLEELHNSNFEQSLYWGFFDGRAPIQKRGKWSEPAYFLCDKYLPYALGGGYVLSQDLVAYIASNSDKLQVFKSEDVSVGTWLAPLKVHKVHDVRFDTEFRSRGCNNKYLVSHKQSVEDLKSKHYSLQSAGVLCEKETRVRASYQYDWDVPPSKCCDRSDSTLP